MADGSVEWGAATRTRPGETASGDLVLVTTVDDGALAAVLDGTGHGVEAARAAAVAEAVLRELAGPQLSSIVSRCHEALRPTRGAAISLAFVSTAQCTLQWLSVGNVQGTLIGAGAGPSRQQWLRTPGGVAGHALPPMRPSTVPLRRGDLLILATDGVRAAFGTRPVLSGPPGAIAQRIVERHWTGCDDAAALVVRFLGGPRA